MMWIFPDGRLAPQPFPDNRYEEDPRVRYGRAMQRSLMTTTPDISGVRLLP
jgi:hypothetical protein